jgi:Holliday junction DNA helicase RuvA
MISHLRGTLIHKDLRFVILDVNGIGYKLAITPDTLTALTKKGSSEVSLWTYLAIRENSHDLYGFSEKSELDFFELLITISGIGPKTAMGILAAANPETIRQAVASGETSHLTKISGIGRKIAEKIVLELRDKIGTVEGDAAGSMKDESDTLEALKALGYSERESREALKKIPKTVSGPSDKIKHALKILGK